MDRKRVLKEAQQLASKYSFWMVSGNISHLYGYVYELPGRKFELEIKFPEKFPEEPPNIIFHDVIQELLGEPRLEGLEQWTSDATLLSIVDQLQMKIKNKLNQQKGLEVEEIPQTSSQTSSLNNTESQNIPESSENENSEGFITPDLDKYPPEQDLSQTNFTPSGDELFYDQSPPITSSSSSSSPPSPPQEKSQDDFIIPENAVTSPNELFMDSDSDSIKNKTELALIQQEYAYDQKEDNPANIVVYLTITLTKTFLINIDFSDYPQKPTISFPNEVKALIRDPYKNLQTFKDWDKTKDPHIIDILHELETKLFTLKDVENQLRKISQEFQTEPDPNSLTRIRVHLLTYGFDEYIINVDLEAFPEPPAVEISSELREIIKEPVKELTAIQHWVNKESEPIEVIRELSWLVDKNSRINFEVELLKEHYQNISYDPSMDSLRVDMKGKMKTEDITFEFEIELPRDYPMSMPKVSVINKFELETHEKIKEDLHASFDDFFDEWTPYSYLVDLFNLISKKIFEVSVIACVICHEINCPTCSLKIAGPDEESCHIECPSCDRVYHKHCWDQTIKSFGKCGFCLKVPPPDMMP